MGINQESTRLSDEPVVGLQLINNGHDGILESGAIEGKSCSERTA